MKGIEIAPKDGVIEDSMGCLHLAPVGAEDEAQESVDGIEPFPEPGNLGVVGDLGELAHELVEGGLHSLLEDVLGSILELVHDQLVSLLVYSGSLADGDLFEAEL